MVYPNKPASYNVQSPVTILSNAPPFGKMICIRFYDRTQTGPEARYNTVTSTDWLWPNYSSGIPTNLYLKISSASSGSWKAGNIFEDPLHPFQCSLRVPANLSVSSSTGGSVIDISGQHPYDSWVDLNATPDNHWVFDTWIGEVEFPNSSNTRVQMTTDKNVTATFKEHYYNLNISKNGKGSVSGSGTFTHNTSVTISATPDTGYHFSHWSGYGPENNNSTTTFNIEGDHFITAVFSPDPHSLTVSSSIGGSASVMESAPYHFDGNYTLSAIPSPGYHFVSWTSPTNSLSILSSNSTLTSSLILNGDASFIANFAEKEYYLNLSMGVGGESISPPSGNYSHFDIVPIEANASTGYEFFKWDNPNGLPNSPFHA